MHDRSLIIIIIIIITLVFGESLELCAQRRIVRFSNFVRENISIGWDENDFYLFIYICIRYNDLI